jgi:hypothetical protein
VKSPEKKTPDGTFKLDALLKKIAEFALQNLSFTNNIFVNEPYICAPPITSLKLDIGQ